MHGWLVISVGVKPASYYFNWLHHE